MSGTRILLIIINSISDSPSPATSCLRAQSEVKIRQSLDSVSRQIPDGGGNHIQGWVYLKLLEGQVIMIASINLETSRKLTWGNVLDPSSTLSMTLRTIANTKLIYKHTHTPTLTLIIMSYVNLSDVEFGLTSLPIVVNHPDP